MTPARNHPWDLTPAEAILLQKQIGQQIELTSLDTPIEIIGGADVSYVRQWNRAFATIILFRITRPVADQFTLNKLETQTYTMEIVYPYIPGLLTFREGPVLEAVWQKLNHRPDLLLFDGAGIGHPRRCGLAAHLGWRWQVASIGCAKSRLIGAHEEVGVTKGSSVPLMDKRTQIGNLVRTRTNVKPLFVSPGYHCNFKEAVWWTLHTTTQYRLPEPTRLADQLTKQMVSQHRNQVKIGKKDISEGSDSGK